MKDFLIGLEIESVFNDNLLSLEIGDYHQGKKFLKNWKAENDGSLERGDKFGEWGKCAEFVSTTFKNRKEFFKGLKDFENFFSKDGKYELKEVLDFNKSCGGHIHFSIKGLLFRDKVLFKIYQKLRDYYLKLIAESNIKSKEEIKIQYFRSYAEEINENNYINLRRHREFNFCGERDNLGLEWRSPNLLNIQTWEEFREYWEIVYKSLKYFYKISQKYEIKLSDNLIFDSYNLLCLKNSLKELKGITPIELNKIKKKIKTYSRFEIIKEKSNNQIEINTGDNKNVQFEYIN